MTTHPPLTPAQALHWFDFDRFMLEARRVLRPNGKLAVIGYGRPRLEGEPAGEAAFKHYYFDVLRSHRADTCWDIDRRRLDTAHEGEDFESHLKGVERAWFEEPAPGATVRTFLDYLETFSAYQKFGADRRVLQPIADALRLDRDPARPVVCVFPFYLVSGTRLPLPTPTCAGGDCEL